MRRLYWRHEEKLLRASISGKVEDFERAMWSVFKWFGGAVAAFLVLIEVSERFPEHPLALLLIPALLFVVFGASMFLYRFDLLVTLMLRMQVPSMFSRSEYKIRRWETRLAAVQEKLGET